MGGLISINEARDAGMLAVRMPKWAFKDDRLELGKLPVELHGSHYGPWTYLVSPTGAAAASPPGTTPLPERQAICIIEHNCDEQVWEEFVE